MTLPKSWFSCCHLSRPGWQRQDHHWEWSSHRHSSWEHLCCSCISSEQPREEFSTLPEFCVASASLGCPVITCSTHVSIQAPCLPLHKGLEPGSLQLVTWSINHRQGQESAAPPNTTESSETAVRVAAKPLPPSAPWSLSSNNNVSSKSLSFQNPFCLLPKSEKKARTCALPVPERQRFVLSSPQRPHPKHAFCFIYLPYVLTI